MHRPAIFFVSSLLASSTSLSTTTALVLRQSNNNVARPLSSKIMAILDKPYGAWESPITSKSITANTVRYSDVTCYNGHIYWLEMRPKEGGRNVLCRLPISSSSSGNLTAAAEEVTPPESNVRTRVHEYGGGAFVLGKTNMEEGKAKDTIIYYSEFASQRLCRVLSNGNSSSSSIPITPETFSHRYADGVLSSDGKIMYCIREDHTNPEPKYVVNEVVSINLEDGSVNIIATGNDFYAAPRLSPDGTKLAYITWNHPNMPWDATELRMVDVISNSTTITSTLSDKSENHTVIAGKDGDTSVIQPMWHPHTGELFYISDQSGFYNIYKAGCEQESILPLRYDFGGSSPGWTLGRQDFAFLNDGRLVAQYTKDGSTVLVVADVVGQKGVYEFSGAKDGLPRMFGGIVPSDNNDSSELFFLGGSPSVPSSIYKWNLDTRSPATVLACSSNLTFPEDVISEPEQIEFPTTLGTAYGYYYAPKNRGFTCTTEKAPPLLVKAHGETLFNSHLRGTK